MVTLSVSLTINCYTKSLTGNSLQKCTHPTQNSGLPGMMLPSFRATGQVRPQRLLLHLKPGATTLNEDIILIRFSFKREGSKMNKTIINSVIKIKMHGSALKLNYRLFEILNAFNYINKM